MSTKSLCSKGNCNINLVIKDTIENIEADLFIQIHATNPLFKIPTLEKAIKHSCNPYFLDQQV